MFRFLIVMSAIFTVFTASAVEPLKNTVPTVWQPIANPVPVNRELDELVESILSQMTLEQKVGQMIQPEIRSVNPADVRKYSLGSVLNGGGSFPKENKQATVSDWRTLAKSYYEASSQVGINKIVIPVLWGTDAVHGHSNVYGATLFPHNIALGATRNESLVEAIGVATAKEVTATGIDWAFSPTVAVARDFRWGRTYESFSEDPALVKKLGASMVLGLQGTAGQPDFLGPGRVIATAKHFIGDGGTANGTDQGNTDISEQELAEIHGAGYRGALGAGAQTVMVSFNSWQGLKLHGHRYLLTDVLKGKLGFDGFVVSDWNGIGQVSGCSNAACVPAVLAGIDIFMVPEDWKAFYGNLIASVNRGEVPMSRIDDAVRRILRVKARMGLLDPAIAAKRHDNSNASSIGSPEHRELARRAVRESLVLLKNKASLLPLKRDMNVLVAGQGADNIAQQSGGWTLTWQGTGNNNADFPGATSIYTGIAQQVKGYGSVELSSTGDYKKRPDVAIVVFGEEPYAEGQGDRSDLNYSVAKPQDLALLNKLKAAGIPVVTVFLTGRPLWTNPEINSSDAFIVAWLPGSEGAGIADVLFRSANGAIAYDVTGRLPFRWPADPTQAQVNSGGDSPTPLFGLGYGLSYKTVDNLSDKLPVPDAPVLQASTEIKMFERGPVSPWRLSVGDKGGWVLPVTGSKTKSANGVITLTTFDRKVQEDSRRAEWTGSGVGQVFLHTTPAQNLTKIRSESGALVIDMMLESRPTKPVELRIDCGYPCGAKADITSILNKAPLNTWFSLSMDLACFENAGADFKHIDTGMLIATSGKLLLSFTGVRMVPGAANKAIIRCEK